MTGKHSKTSEEMIHIGSGPIRPIHSIGFLGTLFYSLYLFLRFPDLQISETKIKTLLFPFLIILICEAVALLILTIVRISKGTPKHKKRFDYSYGAIILNWIVLTLFFLYYLYLKYCFGDQKIGNQIIMRIFFFLLLINLFEFVYILVYSLIAYRTLYMGYNSLFMAIILSWLIIILGHRSISKITVKLAMIPIGGILTFFTFALLLITMAFVLFKISGYAERIKIINPNLILSIITMLWIFLAILWIMFFDFYANFHDMKIIELTWSEILLPFIIIDILAIVLAVSIALRIIVKFGLSL